MCLYSFLNSFCSFRHLEVATPQEYLVKHFLLDVLITNIEPVFVSALNTVYLSSVKGLRA